MSLAALAPSLRWLARGLLNQDLAIQPLGQVTAKDGLPQRSVLTPSHLLLPDDGSVLDGDASHKLYRAAVAHAVAHLKFSTPAVPAAGLKPMTVALVSAIEDARVERLMLHEFPGMKGWFLAPLRRSVQPQGVSFAALMSRLDLALMDPSYQDDHHWVNKARSLFETQALNLGDHAGFRPLAFILASDLGQMRVPFRPQQYRVSAPHRDDNTFLWTHALSPGDPPPELALEVLQPRQAQMQKPRAEDDQAPPMRTEEVALSRHLYLEWDHRLSRARQDWCTVIDKLPPWRHSPVLPQPGFANKEPVALRRARNPNGFRRVRGQGEGDDLDLNAVVAFMVERRSRRSAEARFFTRRDASDATASILVLLDLSESTNERVGDAGQSFLDIEKSAALMLADAVQARGDRIAVHGFSSNTRAEVSYYRLLAFGAPLDASAHHLLSLAPGRHSTRMGAALRHATASLADEPNDLKAIVVLTDGAPSDIDVHEPRYLVEDARHAVHAARAAGVQVHCLAVDHQAGTCVRRIFGWRNHHIVDKPMALPTRLCGLYRGLTAA